MSRSGSPKLTYAYKASWAYHARLGTFRGVVTLYGRWGFIGGVCLSVHTFATTVEAVQEAELLLVAVTTRAEPEAEVQSALAALWPPPPERVLRGEDE